jgi:hypothetical protein
MEASDKPTAPPYFAFKTLTNMLEQMEEPGPPTRIDRSFLTAMSGAGQTQFIHGLKSLGLIDGEGYVQPRLTELATHPDDRPSLIGQMVRERYPEAVELGKGNATTGELVDVFRDHYGVQGDTARKAIAFFLGAAKYAGDIRLSPNFKTPPTRRGPGGGTPKRNKDRAGSGGGNASTGAGGTGGTIGRIDGLHPALAGLVDDLRKHKNGWTTEERSQFKGAWDVMLDYAIPLVDQHASPEPEDDDGTEEQADE